MQKVKQCRMTSILLVDDHRILLDGVEALLSGTDHGFTILKESSGEGVLQRSDLTGVDLIVMDINMKGIDGIETLKQIRKMKYTGKCIFLSSYNDLKLVNEAIANGATGYVTKSSATEYLEEAILTVMKGETYYSPDIKDRILRAFSKSDTQQVESGSEAGVLRQLTERELDVLKLIAMQYTSEEISKQLYIAKSTVDTHRKNLIFKLKVKNAVGLGLFAERNGLI